MTDKAQKAAHWTDANFKENLAKAKAAGKPVFVDFYAEWCGPCIMAAPIVDKLAGQLADKIEIVKVDVDENITTAREYGVMSIPTVVTFNAEGEVAETKVGFPGEEGYLHMINKVTPAAK
jgi:thioredoxin 1